MKQISKITIFSFLFLAIYFFLFNSGVIKFLVLGSSQYFGDYKIYFNAIKCVNLGFSPYNGPGELNCKGFNYGHSVLFFTPLKKLFSENNFFYIPFILIFIFTVSTIKIINPKNYIQFFLCALALLNPSTLLLIERMNLDIILYLIIIFIAYNRIYFLNWLLVIYSFLFKFHPFIYGIIIFIEKEKREIKYLFFIFLFILFASFLFIYLFREEYSLMFKDSGSWKMGLHYLFSIKTIPKILKEMYSFHYGLALILMYGIFLFIIFRNSLRKEFNFLDIYTFEKKLFLISANSLLFCFLTFSNAFYREVFIILIIPYLLINYNYKEFKNLVYILFLKFFINFIYIYILNFDTFYYNDGVRIYQTQFLIVTFLKGLVDYVLMVIIGTLAMKMNIDLLKSLKLLKT
tara:strand:- start:13024 stop:14232 length:1209 start_codon:yes stop_codon:yes gene_type:complete